MPVKLKVFSVKVFFVLTGLILSNCASGEIKFPTRRILTQVQTNTPGVFYRFYVDLEDKTVVKNNVFGVERVYQGNDSNTGEAFFKFYFYQEAGIEICTFKKAINNYECKDLEIIFKNKD